MEIKRQVSYQVSLTEDERKILSQARDLIFDIQLAADQMGAAGATHIHDRAKPLYLAMFHFIEDYCS